MRSQINVVSNECGLKLKWFQMKCSQMNVVSNEVLSHEVASNECGLK